MNNSSGDPVSLEFLIFFHFVFSITFSSQDCPSTVSVKQMLLLFPVPFFSLSHSSKGEYLWEGAWPSPAV